MVPPELLEDVVVELRVSGDVPIRRTLNGADTSAFFLPPNPNQRHGEKLRFFTGGLEDAAAAPGDCSTETGSRERITDGLDRVKCVSGMA
jgi:hypothetical protein